MKKVFIVVNGCKAKAEIQLHQLMAEKFLKNFQTQFACPESTEELRECLWKLQPADYECVILIGGDGTLNQALPAVMGRNLPLLLIAGGTANDLVEELGMRVNWEKVPELIQEKQYEEMDLIIVNGCPFATVGGIGFGALLTLQFNQLRNRFKPINWLAKKMKSQIYSFLSLEQIFFQNGYKHKVRITSESYHGVHDTAAIFICNQQKLGGDLWVSPNARNSDGYMESLIIAKTRAVDVLKVFSDIKRGRPPEGAITFTSKKVVVESIDGEKLCVFGDGETLTKASRLEFSILPSSLKVYRTNRLRKTMTETYPELLSESV